MRKFEKSVLAVAGATFAIACADPMVPDRAAVQGDISRLVTTSTQSWPFSGIAGGAVELCKVSNVPGTFDFTYTVNGGQPQAVSVTAGAPCVEIFRSTKDNLPTPDVVVITENALPAGWATTIDTDRILLANATYPTPRLDDLEEPAQRRVTLYINADMARRTTFTNTFTETPPVTPTCDFITFGRLVTEVGSLKVVISGNAGGFNNNGTIKGEFHVEVNDVDNHVANIATYGPITSGPLSGASFPNARMVTGTAKNGVAVELRLWDGGEPGKQTDWVYVKLGPAGTEPLGAAGKTIDQGNMQYHPHCRGPVPSSTSSTTGKKKP
jgi:hypothetical protein